MREWPRYVPEYLTTQLVGYSSTCVRRYSDHYIAAYPTTRTSPIVLAKMIITVASFKGGVGKTVTAVHLAAYLRSLGEPTVLVDGDPNRSATGWAQRGAGRLPFKVIDERQAVRFARD